MKKKKEEIKIVSDNIKFESAAYFSSPVWTALVPHFVKSMDDLSNNYLKQAELLREKDLKNREKDLNKKIGDFGLSCHSNSMNNDPLAKDFTQFCGQRSFEFLDWCGFDLKNHSIHFTEMWVQQFSKKGGGHHETHVHYNQHVSGFYFLRTSKRTSYPVFHDPRPGAMMTKLPLKEVNKISFGSSSIHYNPEPGTMIIFPGYIPHQFVVDFGLDDFRFIHWNIQVVPSAISNVKSIQEDKK